MTDLKTPLSEIENIDSLRVLAVGGTGGLGRAIAQLLAKHGAKVTVVGRTFKDQGIENIDFIKADLSSMNATRELAASLDVSKNDIILFTTGIFSSRSREETLEGLEMDLATSFLNRLVFMEAIGDKLKHEGVLGRPRVFMMGYPGAGQLGHTDDLNQEKSYKVLDAHMNTVAGNEALVLETAQRYSNLRVLGMNPGLVKTNIRDNLLGTGWFSGAIEAVIGWMNPTPEQYAEKVVPAMLSPKLMDYSGVHIDKNGCLLEPSKGMTSEYAHQFIEECKMFLKAKGLWE